MSYHVIHILNYGSYLFQERAKLVLENKSLGIRKSVPIEDIRALIIAAKGITLSDALISKLLAAHAVILHCDEKFKPIGITAEIERVLKIEILHRQANYKSLLNKNLWQCLLKTKIENQAKVLASLGADTSYLKKALQKKPLNESAVARYYWNKYFWEVFAEELTRRAHGNHLINKMLNYGYAVLTALCHRLVVIHGLSPVFGIHHIPRYHSHAFIYDIVEPLRPWVDIGLNLFFARQRKNLGELFFSDEEKTLKLWAKAFGHIGEQVEVSDGRYRFKLIDAFDKYIASISNVYEKKDLQQLWLPEFDLDDNAKVLTKWVGS